MTVFEASELPGGLNTIGIAAYKITTEYALSEVERVRAMGAEIKLESPIDGAGLVRLMDEYDAVFLGIGLGSTGSLGIPGEEMRGVWEALEFIYQTHLKPFADCRVGRRVVVVGGGNTAIDAANAAIRLGAEKVTVVYRRTQADMPAYTHEYELAKSDGVAFEWLTAPLECLGEDGTLTGLRMQRLEMLGSGREASLALVADSEFTLECDMVVKALGQQPLVDFMESVDGIEVVGGRLVVDPESGATSVPGLFAGGDCISKGAEVVNAVQEGKIAARGIAEFLDGRKEG